MAADLAKRQPAISTASRTPTHKPLQIGQPCPLPEITPHMICSLTSRCVGTMKVVGAGHKICGSAGVTAERRGWCTLVLHKVKCSNSCWERTLRIPSKRDHDVRTTAHSRPNHRSGYLGSRVRREAPPAPRPAHQSRHRFGSTQGSCRRGRPSRRCRRQRACPRHVTTLISYRPKVTAWKLTPCR
jgi:hypothetical protein